MAHNPSPSPPPSMILVYEEVVKETDRVWAERDQLNARATFTIGSASVLLGIVGGIPGALTGLTSPGWIIVHGGLAVCLGLYIAVVITAGRAYARNDFKAGIHSTDGACSCRSGRCSCDGAENGR